MKKLTSIIMVLSLMLFSTSCTANNLPSEDTIQETILTTVESTTNSEVTYEETSIEVSTDTTTVNLAETELETEKTTEETAEEITLDYDNEESFENDLNAGMNLEGKTVRFIVGELHPDSTFGYNIWSGEHLNFVSSKNPDVKVGDVVTAKITSIKNVLGSWIIDYEKLSVQNGSDTTSKNNNSSDEDSRKIKNGFNQSSNQVYTLANYSLEIPSYWKLSDKSEIGRASCRERV